VFVRVTKVDILGGALCSIIFLVSLTLPASGTAFNMMYPVESIVTIDEVTVWPFFLAILR
jgi:hypothetical protein